MIIRWTNQKGEKFAGRRADIHRPQALQMIAEGFATAIDPLDNIERQIIAEKIEARKAQNTITVLHVTPEDLEESEGQQ